jgi:putative colanic acid biosynthesis UDP-glucose lipid carrier transferase
MDAMLFGKVSVGSQGNGWLAMVSVLVPPGTAVVALYCIMAIMGIDGDEPYTVLAVLAFIVTFVIYREVAAVSTTFARHLRDFLQRSIAAWAIVVGCLAVIGFALQYGEVFSRRVLLSWAVVTPLLIAVCQYWAYVFLVQNTARTRTVVIAGVSDLSRRLAKAIAEQPNYSLKVVGWFEDRSHDRVGPVGDASIRLLGKLGDLPAYVRAHNVDVIYIALPIRHEERTRLLLDELHDTTASIYFVPDIFVFDLIQSRVDAIDGIPVLALCETPFLGVNGLVKRISDLTLASLLILLGAPVLLAVAVGVAMTTPGSIIFRQRRYGLDGREIVVYKFRSMSTSDDSSVVRQAQRDDDRITPFGRFIRKYSLDELPQLINVLQGRMSLVGPRPHAVAHNEEYRRLIKGYMIRHKVAPGMTGLAQVLGHRGETKTLEEMRARVEADLEYLRRWSLALDLKILALTVVRLFSDSKAY